VRRIFDPQRSDGHGEIWCLCAVLKMTLIVMTDEKTTKKRAEERVTSVLCLWVVKYNCNEEGGFAGCMIGRRDLVWEEGVGELSGRL